MTPNGGTSLNFLQVLGSENYTESTHNSWTQCVTYFQAPAPLCPQIMLTFIQIQYTQLIKHSAS